MNYANFIARCIEIARRGEYFVAPNPMVGAVLVRNCDEQILAEGWHEQFGAPHAEVNCFRRFDNSEYKNTDLSGCTLFVSLEPCSHYGKTPPCAKLIIEKGVGRVVIGMLDPNPLVAGKGIRMLQEAGIEVITGVMEKECRELNKRFICLHEKKRPYVILKWAQTADGFIDRTRTLNINSLQPNGKEEHLNGALAISTPETKKIVHRMRAENMAIMVGTNTVLLDNPRLLNTHWEGRNPIRVTLDRHNRIPSDARIWGKTPSGEQPKSDYAGIPPVIVYRDTTDWNDILNDLAKRNIHSILVEGGRQLLEHILKSGIWDEIHIELAPELTIRSGVHAPELITSSAAQSPGLITSSCMQAPELPIRSAVHAPQLHLPENYDIIDGHRMYTIKNTR